MFKCYASNPGPKEQDETANDVRLLEREDDNLGADNFDKTPKRKGSPQK